jgi:signal transduction histidine kinase
MILDGTNRQAFRVLPKDPPTFGFFTTETLNAAMIGRQQYALDHERFRISRDTHDDLGARLAEMVRLSNLTQRSGARANGLEVHVGRLSAIVREAWRDHPGMTSIRCRLEAPEEFPHGSLSSDVRHNLCLVVKRTLNNIVKHSRTSEDAVGPQSKNSTLVLIAQDDLRGFWRADRCVCGNGLQNIQTRMRDIAGRFELRSRSGQGTRHHVRLRAKTKRNHAHKRCPSRR